MLLPSSTARHDVAASTGADHAVPQSRRTSVIDSAALLADSKLIHIQHRGELYSLRETRLGKLILTK